MMATTWGEFAASEPEMAALALRQLEPSLQLGICFLATVRKDGSPRLHPVGPYLIDGRLFLIVSPNSPKRFDLARDRRYVLHTLPGPEDEEFRIEGRAQRILDNGTRARVAAVVGHHLHDTDWLFDLTIESALTTYWERWAQPDTRPVRRHWPARR
jgi:hypothetical protein